MTDRCVQCGWTVPDRKREEVGTPDGVVLLHRGGCPDLIDEEERSSCEDSN